ncbi:hypothetical protein AAY473_011322, partial [Plecturocebus cupreus]
MVIFSRATSHSSGMYTGEETVCFTGFTDGTWPSSWHTWFAPLKKRWVLVRRMGIKKTHLAAGRDVQHNHQPSHDQEDGDGQSDDQVDEVFISRCSEEEMIKYHQ